MTLSLIFIFICLSLVVLLWSRLVVLLGIIFTFVLWFYTDLNVVLILGILGLIVMLGNKIITTFLNRKRII